MSDESLGKSSKELLYKLSIPTITSILFSGSFVAAKLTTQDLRPFTTSLLRYLVALIFLGMLSWKSKGVTVRIQRNDWWRIFLLGLFGIVGYHYFFFLALHYTEATNTAIINATSPIVTSLMAMLFLKERLPWQTYIGIVLTACGVVSLLTNGNIESLTKVDFKFGDLLMLVSVVCWAIYSLLIKTLLTRYSSLTLTLAMTSAGVLLLIPLSLFENPIIQLKEISFKSFLSIVYMGIAASGMGYVLYNKAIKSMGPSRTSAFVYSLVPIFVTCLSFFFFQKVISKAAIISIILILFSLQLINWKPRSFSKRSLTS